MNKNKQVSFTNLGFIDYEKCWNLQEELFNETVQQKIRNRKAEPEDQTATVNHLLFCQHPHVYTLGKSGKEKNLLLSPEELTDKNISYHKINRGGDITYHGPGQLVAYPVLDLDNFFTDIHKYLRTLEQVVINTLSRLNIIAGRINNLTGVWVDHEEQINPRKICAMGVKASRWVTMHGLALNVNTNLNYFNYIVPCGIEGKAVTSIEKELNQKVSLDYIAGIMQQEFIKLFGMELIPVHFSSELNQEKHV
jgi:lipoyl(octanoyl) transferase